MVKKCFTCKDKYGSFAYDKKAKNHYCSLHKLDGMYNIRCPVCITCKKTEPSFALIGTKKPIYCRKCRIENTHNVNGKNCIKCNMNLATYNYSTSKIPEYCKQCKEEDMKNVREANCILCNDKTARYGYESDAKPQYCTNCKTDDMVCKQKKLCLTCGKKPARYAYDGEKPQYCKKCKLDGMTAVLDAKCIVCKETRPTFGYIDGKATHCNSCKLEGMDDVKNVRCISCKDKRPLYNYETETKPLYCRECSLPNMTDVRNPKCKAEWCDTFISNKQYEGYCANCYIHIFPEKSVSRNYKTKESSVVQYIKQEFPDIDIITDKRIQDGCSRRRPDIYIDLGYQIVIVEIDENQHIDYNCSCENRRLMELSQDVGHRPIVFIRFNPDDYNTASKAEKKITSCWKINSSGICCVKKSKQKEWNARLQCLKNTIEYWMDSEHRTDKTVEVVQLYYDEIDDED